MIKQLANDPPIPLYPPLSLYISKSVFKINNQEAAEASNTFVANADDGAGSGSSAKETVHEIWYYVRLYPGLTKFLEKKSALYEVRDCCGYLRKLWYIGDFRGLVSVLYCN